MLCVVCCVLYHIFVLCVENWLELTDFELRASELISSEPPYTSASTFLSLDLIYSCILSNPTTCNKN